MKKLMLIGIFFCISAIAFAQKVYFIYLQSDGGFPFYVKMDDKVFSSTSSGYIILPRLIDSTYTFQVGQPENKMRELQFSVTINKKDRGFLLKNFASGWALFDLQSTAVIHPLASKTGVMYSSSVVKTDLFTRMLAQAVDDSTLLLQPVFANREIKPDVQDKPVVATKSVAEDKKKEDERKNNTVTTKKETAHSAVVQKDNPAINGNAAAKSRRDSNVIKEKTSKAIKEDTKDAKPVELFVHQENTALKEEASSELKKDKAAPSVKIETTEVKQVVSEPYKRSVVTRRSESSTTEGFGLVFLDQVGSEVDTIRIIIPNQKPVYATSSSLLQATDSPQSTDKRFLDFSNQKEESAGMPKGKKVKSCGQQASESDFLKLRKNMSAKETEDRMVAEAKKVFRARCFTSEQIQLLSTLFLTQKGKYQFFTEAYPHVSDEQNFSALHSELKDEYYIARFKDLVGN